MFNSGTVLHIKMLERELAQLEKEITSENMLR